MSSSFPTIVRLDVTRPRRRAPRRAVCALGLVAIIISLGACGDSTESRLAEVRVLQTAGQFEASIEPLRVVLRNQPNHPEANYRLGVGLVQTGQPSLAIWPLKKATDSEEYATQAGLMLASTLLSTRAFEEAVRAADAVLANDPDRAGALSTRARANLQSQKPEAALADAQHLKELRPDDPSVYRLLGKALVDLERFDEAEENWIQFKKISEDTDNPDRAAQGCGSLGLFYQGRDEMDKAEAIMVECLDTYPTHALVQEWASQFFIETDRPEKAIEIWRKAIEETPEDLALRSKLADLLYDQKRPEEAEQLLLESVDLFDSTQAWQTLANYYKKSKRIPEAREALEKALERTRREPAVLRFALADLLIEEGDLDRAEQIADEMEEESYQNLLYGSIRLARGDPQEALDLLESGLRLWPNNAGARYIAGRAAQELGDYSRAIAEYREAVRVGLEETDAAHHLAAIYFSLGNYQAAAQFAERHIAKRPYQNPEAHAIYARSAARLGKFDVALGVLEDLAKQEPDSAVGPVEVAGVLRLSSGPEAAAAAIEESGLDLTDPDNVSALRSLGEDYVALHKAGEALVLVEKAVAKHPNDPGFLDLKARLLIHLDQPEKARAALDRALATDPDFAPALEAVGTLAAQNGELERALELFRRASDVDIADAENPYRAAQTASLLGRNEEAMELLRTTLLRSPGHVGACNDLAWFLAEADEELEYAFELAQRAIRLQANADTLDTLGWVQFKRDNPAAAEKAFNLALQQRPDSGSTQYRLGVVLTAQGRPDEARDAFEKALEQSSFPEADLARAELERLQGS